MRQVQPCRPPDRRTGREAAGAAPIGLALSHTHSIDYSRIFTLGSEECTLPFLIQGYPSGAIHREPDFSGSSVGLCSPTSVAGLADQCGTFVSVRFHRRLGRFPVQVVLRLLFVLSVLFGRSCQRIS